MPKLLEVTNLTASYGATQALFGVSFSLEQGKITTILGANGAGKTTTLRALCQTVRTTGSKQVALDSDVLFPFGSATLSAKANAEIARAVQRLQQQPGRRLGVYGHTDGVGSPSSNLTLSRQRADAVRAALLSYRRGDGRWRGTHRWSPLSI
jgi:outer membrane protein OmpA-like peptidoglycan-associated protein